MKYPILPHLLTLQSITGYQNVSIDILLRSLLSAAYVPKAYWTYVFATAVYLINRLSTSMLSDKSPYEKFHGLTPNYEKLRIFGCLCFPWLRPYTSHKLEDRSKPCVFLGYSLTQSAYLCLDPDTGRVYTSRNVQFDEAVYLFGAPMKNNVGRQ